MQICTIRTDGSSRPALLMDDQVIDLTAADPNQRMWRSVTDLIRGEDDALCRLDDLARTAPAHARLDPAGVDFGPPVMPSTVLCSGSNYHAHNAEKAASPVSGAEPEFFLKTADCVIGPGDNIVADTRLTSKLDCETELAIVIGRPGRHIPVETALDHVFGYTVANDVTARDRQVRRTPEGVTWYELGRGKAFDASLPLGPAITLARDIPDPASLTLTTRINGDLRQNSGTGDMIWSCAELIHFFSVNFTLKPGMVILTGTPAGTAWSVDADLGGNWTPSPGLVRATGYCQPGDIVESGISRIGVLRNTVVASPE